MEPYDNDDRPRSLTGFDIAMIAALLAVAIAAVVGARCC